MQLLNNPDFEQSRGTIVRLYYGFCLLVFAFKYSSGIMLHQLTGTLLNAKASDATQNWFLQSGIPQYLLQDFELALSFDLAILATLILAAIFVRSRIFPVLFSLLLVIYYLTGYLYFFGRGHHMSGLLVMSILPWFQGAKHFTGFFYFVRFFLLYILASAGLWKLYNGVGFRFEDQMTRILRLQHAEYIVHHPNSWRSQWVHFLIAHKWLNQFFLKGALVMQLTCLTGFFTKKYDRILLVFVLLFFVGDWLIMNLPFYEMYILAITLLPWKALEEIYRKL